MFAGNIALKSSLLYEKLPKTSLFLDDLDYLHKGIEAIREKAKPKQNFKQHNKSRDISIFNSPQQVVLP